MVLMLVVTMKKIVTLAALGNVTNGQNSHRFPGAVISTGYEYCTRIWIILKNKCQMYNLILRYINKIKNY